MVDERTIQATASRAAEAVDPDEVIRYARALIAAPSENPGGTEDDAAEVAGTILTDLGAATEIVRSTEGRPSVVGVVGSGARPRLAWNGHLDVVPAGDPSTWDHPPFAATVEGDRLIGRGAVDMKGAIGAALAAVAAVRRAGVHFGGTLELHLVADEEHTGLLGTNVLLDAGFLTQDACVVGEPTDLQLALAERGGAWVVATARGVAAHGSRPHLGVNAITSMARFLLRLGEVLPDREHPLVGRPTVNVATIDGGSAPNVVPDRCEVAIDRRTLPGETSREEILTPFERLAAELRAEHPSDDLSFGIHEWCDPAEASRDSAIAEACRVAVAEETGQLPADVGITGITDARYYINQAGIPAVILGPGSLERAHTANEWVGVEELVTAARIYARLFVRFLGG